MKNIMTGLLPYIYHDSGVLIGYMEALEADINNIRDKYGGLTDIIDIDRCPDIFLPYLAEAVQVPLIGEDPVLWRRQIKAWPGILRIKGTEKSMLLLLDSVGLRSIDIFTYWRNDTGKYVIGKPPGNPYLDTTRQLWYNARTHYFSLSISTINNGLLGQYDMNSLRKLIAEVKPYHADLLELTSNMSIDEISEPLEESMFNQVQITQEAYPWKGAFYNSIHRYARSDDASALLYSDPGQCEDIINEFRHGFCEFLWAPYTYNSSFVYDGTKQYSDAVVEKETLATFHSVGMADELQSAESYENTLFIYI